jgi:DNA-binding NarL/FixJ family response regulator
VGGGEDGLTAVSLTRELRPDVLLLDLGLPVLNGVEVTRKVRALPAPPQVLVLTAYDDVDYVMAALGAGAGGFMLKTAGSRDVAAAVLAVARGEIVLHPAVARQVITPAPGAGSSRVLSDRELEVVRLAARGRRTKEIAEALAVSVRTVEAHFTSVFNKLGVSSRTEAIVHAASRGWVTLERDPLG